MRFVFSRSFFFVLIAGFFGPTRGACAAAARYLATVVSDSDGDGDSRGDRPDIGGIQQGSANFARIQPAAPDSAKEIPYVETGDRSQL